MSGNGSSPRSLKGLEMDPLQSIIVGAHSEPDWFIEGILPQGCFLICGRPKIGKSWLLFQLGIVLASGGKMLGHEALGQFQVVYFASEDDLGRIASRFRTYRCSSATENLSFICRDRLSRYAAEFSEHYTLAEFIDLFLYENPQVKAVILDTESTVRAAWDGGSVRRDVSITRNDYAEVREFDEIAHRRKVSIALVNHTAKRKNDHWVDIHELINRTNTALAGASGSWVLADPPVASAMKKDGCKVIGIRGRDILDDHLLAVKRDDFGVFQNLGNYEQHRQSETEREVLEALEEIAKSEPETWKTAKQIATYLSRSTGSVQQVITRMINKHRTSWKDYTVETKTKLGVRLLRKT